MNRKPNAQYNLISPDSMSARAATRVRRQMFDAFVQQFDPTAEEAVLDVGATSDRTFASSNYFELLYPHKSKITVAGIDDASFLEELFPGVKFAYADVLDMPFHDEAFDLVHSSAVLEHVGSFENQVKMVVECLRVARRGACLTTPNRWFPVEVHTQLPLIHWLPKRTYRAVFRGLGYGFFADEANLIYCRAVRFIKSLPDSADGDSKLRRRDFLGGRAI